MKTVYIPIMNSGCLRDDHYDNIRTEGRYGSNIGVGLSKIGFHVDLQNRNWSEKQITENLRYVHRAPDQEYDFAFTFGSYHLLDGVRAKKYILMFYTAEEKESGLKFVEDHDLSVTEILFVNPFKDMFDIMKNDYHPYSVKFFPPVFPIPDYSMKFLEFTYLPTDTIKLYSQISVNMAVHNYTPEIVVDILNAIRHTGKKAKLYLQTSDVSKFRGLDDDIIFLDRHVPYNKMYDLINSCDMGLILLSGIQAGAAQFDFISLGKPILCLLPNLGRPTRSPLLTCVEDIFEHHEGNYSVEDLMNFVNDIVTKPFQSFSRFRESMKTCEFPIWRKTAIEDIFK